MEYYRKILLLFFVYTIFTTIFILPSVIADDDEDDDEDVVGEILEDQGIPRNPPEVETSPEVAPPEVAGSTGQISSFAEGPVVVGGDPNAGLETNTTGNTTQ